MSESYLKLLKGRFALMSERANRGEVPVVETLVSVTYHELDELGLDSREYETKMRNCLIKAYERGQEECEAMTRFAESVNTINNWKYGVKLEGLKLGETPYDVVNWDWRKLFELKKII